MALIEQCLSGNPGASFDKNRVPSRPIAAGQHAALLTIATACHGLRCATGAIECFAGIGFAGIGALISLLHIKRLSIYGAASLPRPTVFDYFHARPVVRQTERGQRGVWFLRTHDD